MSRYEITAEQWERIKDLLPTPHKGKGRPAKDNRMMLNGIINKCVYSVLGINMDGMKEILGTWISEN